jgi:hypothetical protein
LRNQGLPYAGFFIAMLNWIHGSQANITFDLVDAEWVTVPDPPYPPISRYTFLKSIASQAPAGPDLTVFLVG